MLAQQFVPLDWQQRLLETNESGVVYLPRLTGRTTFCAMKARDSSCDVLYIAPTLRSVRHFLQTLTRVCPEAEIHKTGATLPSGTHVHCASHGNHIRGINAGLALIDDAEYVHPTVYEALPESTPRISFYTLEV